MKKFILIVIASIGINFYLSSQTPGEYRSIGSGNWNDPTKWETYNGSSFVAALTYPGQNPGTGSVSIMNQTEIVITTTIPNPIFYLVVDAEYACSCDNYSAVPLGKLTFSAESAISLIVTRGVSVFGELLIDNKIGAKAHSLFIGGSLILGDGWGTWDNGYRQLTIFQTVNQDDKLDVTFNTTFQNSVITGSEYSTIGGASFQDVTFNGIGITMETNCLIKGHANFVNGTVKTQIISFGEGATHSGASDASFVEGAVTKQGNDAFTFPIGRNGIYAPLTISAPIGQTETFRAGYNRSDAESLGTISDPGLFSVSNCEYWSLQAGWYNSNNYPLDVTVGWTSASGCGSPPYINNVSDVTLASSTINNVIWDSHGGAGIGTTTNGSVTRTGVTRFGLFTLGNLGSCAAPFGLNTTNIAPNSATLNWSALTSSVSCSVEYKPASSGTWINVTPATTSKSVNLTGLSPSTGYNWRIRSNCASASSMYRVSNFTTPVVCGDPTGLTTTNITSGSAILTWGAVTYALNYDVEYKQSGMNTWIRAVTGTTSLSYNLTGLLSLNSYDWRVHANCSAGIGNYSQAYFTTPLPDCNTIYEPNNSFNEAKSIGLGTTIFAGITSANDVDFYKITTPNNSNTSLLVELLNLPADYDLYIYNKSLKLIASSVNTGTYEGVIYNSTARKATYYIKVMGKNGAYNAGCYSLLAQAFSSGNKTASQYSVPVNEVAEDPNKQLLFPNPASEFVQLSFTSTVDGQAAVQIFNTAGQLLKQPVIKINKGYNQVKVAVNDIKQGMYLLKINKGELNMVRRFVIAR